MRKNKTKWIWTRDQGGQESRWKGNQGKGRNGNKGIIGKGNRDQEEKGPKEIPSQEIEGVDHHIEFVAVQEEDALYHQNQQNPDLPQW